MKEQAEKPEQGRTVPVPGGTVFLIGEQSAFQDQEVRSQLISVCMQIQKEIAEEDQHGKATGRKGPIPLP